MRYVDAGYTVALATLFVYGISLVRRRRRWEGAVRASESADGTGAVAPGERP